MLRAVRVQMNDWTNRQWPVVQEIDTTWCKESVQSSWTPKDLLTTNCRCTWPRRKCKCWMFNRPYRQMNKQAYCFFFSAIKKREGNLKLWGPLEKTQSFQHCCLLSRARWKSHHLCYGNPDYVFHHIPSWCKDQESELNQSSFFYLLKDSDAAAGDCWWRVQLCDAEDLSIRQLLTWQAALLQGKTSRHQWKTNIYQTFVKRRKVI